ncbi:hypothetical protein GCM10018966_021750 [Streptomyces yanii]
MDGSALKFKGQAQYAETAGPVVDTTRNCTVSAWATPDEQPAITRPWSAATRAHREPVLSPAPAGPADEVGTLHDSEPP